MTREESFKKMEDLNQAMNLAQHLDIIARRKLKRAHELLEARSRAAMAADIDLMGSRREFANFCQGIRE